MRRLRPAPARLALVLMMALLASALPGAAPRAAAQDAPTFAPVVPRGEAAIAASGGSPAQPELALPSDPVAPEVRTGAPTTKKTAGLTPGSVSFGPAGELGVQSLSAGCEVLLNNSDIDYVSPEGDFIYDWYSLQGLVNLEVAGSARNYFFSYPYAINIGDHDELGLPDDQFAADEDWFGQDFILPADAQSITLQFNALFATANGGGLDSADYTFAELYLIDEATGDLVDAKPSTPILDGAMIQQLGADQGDQAGTWYRYSFTYTAANSTAFSGLLGKRVAVVFSLLGDKQFPYEQPVFDNIQITACPTAAKPDKMIEGYVERNGVSNASTTDATLALLYSPDGNPDHEELIRTTTADWDADPFFQGYYRFSGLPALPPGGYYQVYYLRSDFEYENDDPATTADDRLSYYAGPHVSAGDFGPNDISGDPCISDACADGGSFEIADVTLLGPDAYTRDAGTVTFSWQASPIPGAKYLLCFFDPDTLDEVCTTNPLSGTSTTATAAALQAGGLVFGFDDYIGWYVRVLGPGYTSAAFADTGASGYSHYFAFLAEKETAPPPPPAGGSAPAGDPDTDDWTLMFYMAGDDEDLSNPPGFARSMQDMVPALIGLADTYPNVNIVVQFDFYESDQAPLPSSLRGTQFCYFKPGVRNLGQLCESLGEQSMADPATLTTFITKGQTKYPANHTALIILGHGSPVAGVAGERTGGDDALDPTELDKALADANLTGQNKLDLLVFYNCLMGSYEVATLAQPYADYMVASPNITTLIDINPKIVELASKNPTSPKSLATGIVSAYDEAMSAYNDLFGTSVSVAMSAFDLSRLGTITPLVNALATALIDNLTRPEVRSARDTVQEYDSSAPILWGFNPEREDALVDMGDLSAKLAGSPNQSVAQAAAALRSALLTTSNPFILAKVARTGVADLREGGRHTFAAGAATGVSIYFPNGNTAGAQAALTRYYLLYYRQLGFGAGTWDELVEATRTGLPSLPRSIKLAGLAGQLGTTLQTRGTPQLFPPAASMPGGSTTYLPLTSR